MSCARSGEKNRKKTVVTNIAAVLICTAATVGFSGGETVMRCEAREEDAEKEVVDFVTAYYEAQTPEKIETLADYVSKPEDIDFQMSLVSLQILFEHGLTNVENIRVVAYPLSDGEHWMAMASRELVIQDFDVTLPGLNPLFVGRNQDGELQIEPYIDYEMGSAFLEEMREISLSDEVVDWNTEIARKYNDAVAEYPDVAEWLLEVTNDVEEAQAEAAAEFLNERENGGKKTDGYEKQYVVKKGDCLWSIAEEQLGDGMLWSDIYETNKAVIGEDPNLIYVGIELTLQ